MPYLQTAQEWLTQSTLLLQARPSSTRISTKYNVPNPSPPPKKSSKARSSSKPAPTPASTSAPSDTPAQSPVAFLDLKTYDNISGTTLKYRTDKAAEVGRLIQILGRLARPMAGLPETKEDVQMEEAGKDEGGAVAATQANEGKEKMQVQGGKGTTNAGGGAGGGAGGKKGKKKGKK